MVFAFVLRIETPEETVLCCQTQVWTTLGVPFVHLLLGAATDDENRVSLVLRNIIEYVKHMRVWFLIPAAAFHW